MGTHESGFLIFCKKIEKDGTFCMIEASIYIGIRNFINKYEKSDRYEEDIPICCGLRYGCGH
jgi:hypothetical protein